MALVLWRLSDFEPSGRLVVDFFCGKEMIFEALKPIAPLE